MAYEKLNWKDYPNKTTPTSATNFDHMDQGIYENSSNIGDISKISDVADGTLAGAVAKHESKIGETDISEIDDGTVTGALHSLNNNLADGNVRFSIVDGELYYSIYTEDEEV